MHALQVFTCKQVIVEVMNPTNFLFYMSNLKYTEEKGIDLLILYNLYSCHVVVHIVKVV